MRRRHDSCFYYTASNRRFAAFCADCSSSSSPLFAVVLLLLRRLAAYPAAIFSPRFFVETCAEWLPWIFVRPREDPAPAPPLATSLDTMLKLACFILLLCAWRLLLPLCCLCCCCCCCPMLLLNASAFDCAVFTNFVLAAHTSAILRSGGSTANIFAKQSPKAASALVPSPFSAAVIAARARMRRSS